MHIEGALVHIWEQGFVVLNLRHQPSSREIGHSIRAKGARFVSLVCVMIQTIAGLEIKPAPSIRQQSNRSLPASRHLWVSWCALVAIVLIIHFRPTHPFLSSNPVFDPPEGVYEEDVVLKIRVSSPHIKIIYTLNGSIPTLNNGLLYENPLLLPSDPPGVTVIRARAFYQDGSLGPVMNASYFCGMDSDLALMSMIVEPEGFWGQERGIYANPTKRGMEWERPVDVLYLEAAGDGGANQVGFHVPAGVRIHGGTTRMNAPKKSLRLYWREEYGLTRLEYPLFIDEESEEDDVDQAGGEGVFKRLVVHNGGQDYTAPNWTLVRIRLMNDLAGQIGVYSTTSKPVLLFINGKSQGIYQLRERIDDWYFDNSLDLESVDYLDTPFVPTAGRDGDHWEHLVQFLETHDLADDANYEYITTQIDVDGFLDYAILQMFAANNDWLHHNVDQFRPRTQGGRWDWILWDIDYSFGKEWQSFYDFNMIDWLYTETQPNFERGSLLLRKLLDNPDFRIKFISRSSDLLNTVFYPDRVAARVDELAAELRDSIQYEVARWPRKGDWEESVEKLLEFVRRRPDAFRQNMIDGFGLAGTDAIQFTPPAIGQGRMVVNGLLLPEEPWQGIYFKGLDVTIMAAPASGYRFVAWQAVSKATGNPVVVPNTPELVINVQESLTITPVFELIKGKLPRPNDVSIEQVHLDEDGEQGGAWIELQVNKSGSIDLRGWRITDNDTKTATGEGSLIFPWDKAFSHIPTNSRIFIILSGDFAADGKLPPDDLIPLDGRLVLFVGNGLLDGSVDPGFELVDDDNLALLAPGPTGMFDDDRGIAFMTIGDQQRPAVNSASFGILVDGVIAGIPSAVPPVSN